MKSIYFSLIIMTIFLPNKLFAEPTLGILKKVHTNNALQFSINAKLFTCKNYGIIMIDDVSEVENTCKQRLLSFIDEHPEHKEYSAMNLKRYQQYRLHIVNSECIINAKGRKTLAEMLLENGLAVRDSKMKNIVYEYKFKRAELRAKREKKGIYSDAILRSCVNVLK